MTRDLRFLRELVLAMRALRKSPSYTLFSLLTLALGSALVLTLTAV